MILESASFCITQNKSKGEVDFEHSRLIRKDAAELFAESSGTHRRQAKIVPILKSGCEFVASVAGTSEQYPRQSLR